MSEPTTETLWRSGVDHAGELLARVETRDQIEEVIDVLRIARGIPLRRGE